MINKKKTPRLAASGSVLRRPSVESMESRRLLSASPSFMAGRFWDFTPAQTPPMLFARPGSAEGVVPGATSPDLMRPFSESPVKADRFDSPWHAPNSSSASIAQWVAGEQFQSGQLTTNSDFPAMNWQGGSALIIDIPTAFSLPGGATTEVVYSIAISGPFFSAGSIQGTTLLMTTSFHANPPGTFGAINGFAPGGLYRDGVADRTEMPEPDDYAPPANPSNSIPPPNASTPATASDAPSGATARPNLLHSQPATVGSTAVASAGSTSKISHTGTSQIPAVSAVTSASGIASTAATIASVAPRMLMLESAAILHTADEVVRVVGGTLATTGASAATTIVPQVANGAKSFAAAAPIVMQETAAVAQPVVHVNPIDAVATFSDALAAFARDCAGIGTAKVNAPDPRRAWAITGAVLAADAILIGQWYARRSRNQQESEEEQKTSEAPAKRAQPMIADLPLVK